MLTRQLTNWRINAERRKTRIRSVILLSLILHMVVAIVYLFLPMNRLVEEQADAFAVELVSDADAPRKRRERPKPPLTKKLYDPSEELARNAMKKKIETAPNKQDEVIKFSPRVVLEDVELNNAPLSETLPDVMTAAQLRDAEASNLSRLVRQPGRTDGRGIVTGRVRARGDGMGRFRGHSQDGSDGGLLGGGGKDGATRDRLGIIDFLNEFEGPQNVVYCLDISASMQAAGLQKLELAVNAIKDSVMNLGSDDALNVVAFSTTAKAMSKNLLPANAENIKRTSKYLDSFTPRRIADNTGTNILEALDVSLKLDASVVVLVTDGLPVAIPGHSLETDTQKILEVIRAKNLNNARIYVVALEIDVKHSPGAELLVSLAEQHNGKLKVINSALLAEYAEEDGLPQ